MASNRDREFLATIAAALPARSPARYAVHAFKRQVWAGTDPAVADRIISEYASLGQRATKHKTQIGR